MKTAEWYQELLNQSVKTLEYQLEGVVLNFTEDIYNIMQEKGLSKKDLAELIGTSPAYITKLLSGNANPSLKTIVKLAMALERNVDINLPPKVIAKIETHNMGAITIPGWSAREATFKEVKSCTVECGPVYLNLEDISDAA